VTEMSEQVRLWFYSMLFMSVVLEGRPPYEQVMCHSMVAKEDGGKFSKTGYMIQFDEAAEEIGSDSIRYLFAGAPITSDVRFGFTMGDEARRKLLGFRNIFTFFDTYYQIDKPDLSNYQPDYKALCALDTWLLLRTNQFIQSATKLMDSYKAFTLVKEFEDYVEDVSNWYIRLNRRRFWKAGDAEDKRAAYFSLYFALKSAAQVMAPIIPFQTEAIWQKLVRAIEPDAPLSIHLSAWPAPLPDIEDGGLLEQTELVREVIATALRLRNENNLKVRQPLQTLFICCSEELAQNFRLFYDQLLAELNVKEIMVLFNAEDLQMKIPTVNFKLAGAALKSQVNAFKNHLAELSMEDAQLVAAQIELGGAVSVPGWEGALDAGLFTLQARTMPGIVSTTCQNGEITVALDIELTDDLRREGAVRDVIRQIQTLRKEAGYAVEQRIKLHLATRNPFLEQALNHVREHIKSEVLADDFDFECGGLLERREQLRQKFEAAEPFDISREIEIAGAKILLEIAKSFNIGEQS